MRRRIVVLLKDSMKYNFWYALIFEITDILIHHDFRWSFNKWIIKIRDHTFCDWVDWKEERTMVKANIQMEELEEFYKFLEQDKNQVIVEYDRETGTTFGYTIEEENKYPE